MILAYTPHFRRSFKTFSALVQRRFEKQVALLLRDLRHPSLHAKKYDERQEIWQARVDRNVRFYFCIRGETYLLLDIKVHPK